MKTKSIIAVALSGLLLAGNISSGFAQTSTKQASSKSTVKKKKTKLKNSQKGALIGAGAGAVIGGVIASKSKNTAIGAIIGATVGGAAGAVIGNKMDKKAEELRRELGSDAKVERVGEGVKLTMGNNLLFDFGSSELRSETLTNLKGMAATLRKDQEDTEILIEGNTDSVGSDAFNKSLSQQRANAVKSFLVSEGVSESRIRTIGLGESNPVSTNDTDLGRQQNRRVEVAIFASEKLKREAAQTSLSFNNR